MTGRAILACGLALASACTDSEDGGNPFDRHIFDPLPADLDCTPITFTARMPAPQCLLDDPPKLGTTTELPDGSYLLSSWRGPCNGPWIDASMTVQTLADGQRLVKERRPSTDPAAPRMLDYAILIDPTKPPGTEPRFVCGANGGAVQFTVIDSVTMNGKATVAIRVDEFYVLVYTQQ